MSYAFDTLHHPGRYEAQITKKIINVKTRHGIKALFEMSQHAVPLFCFDLNRMHLAKILAASVKNESYQLSPPKQRIITPLNKKKRLLYQMLPTDQIVVGVLAKLFSELFDPFISRNIYSFRTGLNAKKEIEAFTKYIETEKKRTGVKGVFIFQTDIKAYADAINVADHSPLWNILNNYLKSINLCLTPYQKQLVTWAIRPENVNLAGFLQCNLTGVPTGSPMVSLVYNLFLTTMDHLLAQEPHLFYARYGDDILLCHSDLHVIKRAEELLKEQLKSLKLSLNHCKTHKYYFSPAGNQTTDPCWKGTNRMDALGFSISGNGTYCLSDTRQRIFLHSIYERIKSTKEVVSRETIDEQGVIMCQMVNATIKCDFMRHHSAILLLRESNDRGQLKHLDYCIALAIAKSLSGEKSVKAFRQIPYRKMREEWGLQSLVHLRNTDTSYL